MTHLGERLTDFALGELPASEMEEARRHLASCADCRNQVEQFERTRSMLKMAPDVEPPRRILFEFEKPRQMWRWLVPGAIAAAVLIVLLVTPMQIQWHDSQLTIAIGTGNAGVKPAATNPARVALMTPTVAAVQPIDYDGIAKRLEPSERAWLVEELKKHDEAQMKRIQVLEQNFAGNLAYVEARQDAIAKDNADTGATIQKLAAQLTGAQ